MRRLCRAPWLAALALLAWGIPSLGAPSTPFVRARDAVDAACRFYTAYDRDRDGHAEIVSLRRCRGVRGSALEARGAGRGTVLVVVEERVWLPPANPEGGPDLRPALGRLVQDIGRDGWHAFALSVSMYAGPRHQDGLIVLALRDMLRAVRERDPGLAGAILVGNFPYPYLSRQCYWRRPGGAIALNPAGRPPVRFDNVPWVNSIAEPLVSPADIVLADLDGAWDQLYRQPPTVLGGFTAAFPDDPAGEVATVWEHSVARFEDFFFVGDGTWEEEPLPDGKRRFRFRGEPNDECAAADRGLANVLARPEIAVSRLNARRAGLVPDPSIRGVRGEGLLDSSGRPQMVELAGPAPPNTALWRPCEAQERRLLLAYLDRNHRYRTGGFDSAARPASISTEWGSAVPDMRAGVPAWRTAPVHGLEHAGIKTSVADFVSWMRIPATARSVKAHSGPTLSEFAPAPDPAALDRSFPRGVWYWTRDGARLVPSLRGIGGHVHFGLLRTLWENRSGEGAGAIYMHIGCEVVRPGQAETEPYTSPQHGLWQLGEALLHYGDGVALVARGKVFYDEPREFWKTLGGGGTVGDAWRRYFDIEAADAELARVPIDRKRAYFWSILGDFTLTVRPRPEASAR
ncbi:MAG TPA: hypothetical protein VLH79_00975 [Chthonomonadales bacterium]|nr:hypothetical protein [Chthonomonadales bacterium]